MRRVPVVDAGHRSAANRRLWQMLDDEPLFAEAAAWMQANDLMPEVPA